MNRTVLLRAALADAVLILIFVIIGRANHDDGLSIPGIVSTWWPFAAGAAVGWSLCYVWVQARSTADTRHRFEPASPVPEGVVIWVCTVAIGMVLRVLFNQGIAVSFVIVAAVVLGVFLLGWRVIAGAVERRRHTGPTESAAQRISRK